MILADASAIIDGLRGDTVRFWAALESLHPDEIIWAVALPTRMEVLMGARNEQDWHMLEKHLAGWTHLEMFPDDWTEAARIYTDLRQAGLTVRSPIDCCIAQAALSHNALLLHRDRDFDLVAKVRPKLRLQRIPALPNP